MKKIFTLFSALLLTVSMWGANEYNATINGDVTLTDLSSYWPKYQLDFAQVGKNSSGTYNSTVCMILEPYEEGLAGTYRLDDWTINSNSYVKYGSEERKVCDYTGKPTEIVITDNGNGSYTISGAFRTKIYKLDSKGNYSWFYYYYYFNATDPNNTFTPVTPDPYAAEPAKVDAGLSFETDYLTASSQSGKILFDLGDPYGDETITLAFASSFVQPDAKNYSVAASGTDIFLASTGMGTHSPEPSYMMIGSDFYFIVDGSLDISYSDDNKKMTIAGTVISAHGTEITISATGTNPWGPKPEVELNVTEVKPSVSGTNVTLAITSSTEPKTGVIYAMGVSALTDITISKLYYYNTYFGNSYNYLDNTDANNAISITSKGNNVYELNAKLACNDGKIYVIEGAEFSYNPAYSAEPGQAYSTINVRAYDLTYSTVGDYILFDFENSDGSKQVKLSFHAGEFNMAAGTYDIAADAEGKFLASEGRISNVDQPSYYYNYVDSWDNAIYYMVSGSIAVSFSADQQTIYMTGTVTTAHGSTISLDLAGMNPFAPKEKDFTITGWNQKMLRMEEGNVLVFDMNGAGQGELSRLHVEIPASQLEGEFTSLALDYTFFGSDGVYDDVVENANNIVTIEKVQGGYQLGATLVGESGVTYTVAPAVFDKYLVTTTDEVITAAQLNNLMSEVVDFQVGRAFADGMWQTICLPFDIANVAESPLAGATVKSVTSCSLSGETLLVEAVDVTAMTAGMPYLIMWKDGAPLADNHTFEGVTIAASEGAVSGNFVANMSAKHYDDVTGKYMVVANNGLAPMGTEGSVKGFRAFFQLNVSAGVAPRKFAFATSVVTDNEQVSETMPVRKTLVNGQLLIIKDNKVFNAQAQELK